MVTQRIDANAESLHQSVIKNVSSSSAIESWCQFLGTMASTVLVAEANLTPKPALVDKRGSGAHIDLTLEKMFKSAMVLEPFFQEMARMSSGAHPNLTLREELAECGRRAEVAMYQASGSNSHRGAIWCLGLLVAAVAMQEGSASAGKIAATAAGIAAFPDLKAPDIETHGLVMKRTYGVGGARIEAQSGFPHVIEIGLPHLRNRRLAGASENSCRLDTLLAIMTSLDDTCLLYRGGLKALQTAQSGARQVIAFGGTDNPRGMDRLFQLDRDLLQLGASPGGSADLLAATLFLDALDNRFSCYKNKVVQSTDSQRKTIIGWRN